MIVNRKGKHFQIMRNCYDSIFLFEEKRSWISKCEVQRNSLSEKQQRSEEIKTLLIYLISTIFLISQSYFKKNINNILKYNKDENGNE